MCLRPYQRWQSLIKITNHLLSAGENSMMSILLLVYIAICLYVVNSDLLQNVSKRNSCVHAPSSLRPEFNQKPIT